MLGVAGAVLLSGLTRAHVAGWLEREPRPSTGAEWRRAPCASTRPPEARSAAGDLPQLRLIPKGEGADPAAPKPDKAPVREKPARQERGASARFHRSRRAGRPCRARLSVDVAPRGRRAGNGHATSTSTAPPSASGSRSSSKRWRAWRAGHGGGRSIRGRRSPSSAWAKLPRPAAASGQRSRWARSPGWPDDLALALAARSIRIQAPVPGKGYVGIAPNTQPAPSVNRRPLRDDGDEYGRMKSPLRSAGQNVAGQPIGADLAAMPHLLIAGTTGSGKSVCVNGIIACLLLQNTPDDLRLVMIDPKMVELTGYNGVPHLAAPVVVDMDGSSARSSGRCARWTIATSCSPEPARATSAIYNKDAPEPRTRRSCALHRHHHRRTGRPDDAGSRRSAASPVWRRWPARRASTWSSPRSARRSTW